MKKLLSLLLVSLGVGSLSAHQHYGAGVLDGNRNNLPDVGEALQLVTRPAAGTFFHLLAKPTGERYGGFYSLDEQPRTEYSEEYFSFVALSDGHALAAEPGHAANGADIWMEITSVSGPTGGSLGFWESSWSYNHTTPTASFPVGESTRGYKFQLSEPLPVDPDGDPYGHIHDRGWTVDVPGVYTVGFTLYDMSTASPGGGPIHAPSQTYYFTFVAGVPDPTPAPTATPTIQTAAPTVKVSGAKKRTATTAKIVLKGTVDAPAGLSAVQVSTKGAFLTVSRTSNWKATIKLKVGTNRVKIRAVDTLGRVSKIQQIVIRRP